MRPVKVAKRFSVADEKSVPVKFEAVERFKR